MKMTAMPSALSPRITSSSFSVSCSGRLEVGSSRMMSRASQLSALAISTICCCASDSLRTGVLRAEIGAEPAQDRRHGGTLPLGVDNVEKAVFARLAADEDIGGDVEIVEEVEFLVHERDAGADRLAHA